MTTKRAWKLQEFQAHTGAVTCLSLGRKSGRVLATGGDDKRVNLWAVGSSECILSFPGHTHPIESVRFSASEELVCGGSQSGAIRVWDLAAAKLLRTLTGHRGAVKALDFHPYGDFLVSGSQDTNFKLWDVRRKGCIYNYKGHTQSVSSVKFSPDGQWVVSAGDDGAVKVWDIRAGKLLAELLEHTSPVTSVEFHPHEFLLASASTDRRVLFWDLESFQLISAAEKAEGAIRSIAFHPEGDCLFSGSQEGLRVYGWEPCRILDTVPLSWARLSDLATTSSLKQLIGASYHWNQVSVFVVDLKRVQPIGGPPTPSNGVGFKHGQTLRKSFSKDRPPGGLSPKVRVEDSDKSSSTDAEDDSSSNVDIADFQNYREIFRGKRELNRTPPPPEPLEKEKEEHVVTKVMNPPPPDILPQTTPKLSLPMPVPQDSRHQPTTPSPPTPTRNGSNLSLIERSRTPSKVRPASRQERRNSFSDKQSPPSSGFAGRLDAHRGRPRESVKDLIQSSSDNESGRTIRHSPSEPVLNRQTSHSRSSSLTRGARHAPDVVTSRTRPDVTVSSAISRLSRGLVPARPPSSLSLSVETSSLRGMPGIRPSSGIESPISPIEPFRGSERMEYVSLNADRPAGLSLEDFVPRRLTSGLSNLSLNLESPDPNEEEAVETLVKGFQPLQISMAQRLKNLQVVQSLWASRDPKVALDTAISMGDQGVIVDVLSVVVAKPSVWSLDLCTLALPAVNSLLQSKYEMYVNAASATLRLILSNFLQIIKTNLEAPAHTVGVDISREERYNKSMACYSQLMPIKAFVQKRQTVQGKTGQNFRELHLLLQTLD